MSATIKAQRPIVRTSVKLLTTNCWLASAAMKVPRIVSDDCCRNSLALIAKKTTISAAPNPYPLTVVPQVRNNGLKPAGMSDTDKEEKNGYRGEQNRDGPLGAF